MVFRGNQFQTHLEEVKSNARDICWYFEIINTNIYMMV